MAVANDSRPSLVDMMGALTVDCTKGGKHKRGCVDSQDSINCDGHPIEENVANSIRKVLMTRADQKRKEQDKAKKTVLKNFARVAEDEGFVGPFPRPLGASRPIAQPNYQQPMASTSFYTQPFSSAQYAPVRMSPFHMTAETPLSSMPFPHEGNTSQFAYEPDGKLLPLLLEPDPVNQDQGRHDWPVMAPRGATKPLHDLEKERERNEKVMLVKRIIESQVFEETPRCERPAFQPLHDLPSADIVCPRNESTLSSSSLDGTRDLLSPEQSSASSPGSSHARPLACWSTLLTEFHAVDDLPT